MRIGAHDHLAVKLEHETQYAVRRRMLRAKVHCVVAYFSHGDYSRSPYCGSRTIRGVISRGSIVTG